MPTIKRKTLRTRYRELEIREKVLERREREHKLEFDNLIEQKKNLLKNTKWLAEMHKLLLPKFPSGANWEYRKLYWISIPIAFGYITIHNIGKVLFPEFGHTLTYMTGLAMMFIFVFTISSLYSRHNKYVIIKGDYVDDDEKNKKRGKEV